MSGASLAQTLAVSSRMKRLSVGAQQSVRVGFLAPLTGPIRSWGCRG